MRNKLFKFVLFLIVLESLVAHATPRVVAAAPRSDQPKDAFAFTKIDDALLEQANLADQKLERNGQVYKDPELDEYINRIGQSLLPPGPVPEKVHYQFHVARDPMVNAFALPNGSIYVNTGLLALLDNEDELAGVLGHEITHVTNRHSYLENRSERKKILAVNILVMVSAFAPYGAIGSTIYTISEVSQALLVASIYGYSREKEQEADVNAIGRMSAAKYDPKEFANSFRLLEQDYEGEQVKMFYSDHPKLEDRVSYVSAIASKNPAPTEPFLDRTVSHNRYRAAIEKVARHNTALAIEARRFRTAIAMSEKLVQFNANSADNLATLADARSALGPRSPKLTDQEKTSGGKKEIRKLNTKLTIAEEEKELSSTTEGESTMRANRALAEEIYKKALSVDPNSALAHRGLGFLYEKLNRPQEAVVEFRKYVELQPNALDRGRVSHRIEALEKGPSSPDKKP